MLCFAADVPGTDRRGSGLCDRQSPGMEPERRMSDRYRVLVVGMGKRGMHHAAAFQANGRFDVVGICDIDDKRVSEAAVKLGVAEQGTDAAAMARALRPDVFCFCTLPGIRSSMIEI